MQSGAQTGRIDADATLADLRALLLRGLQFALASYRVTENDLEDFTQDGLIKILQELSSIGAMRVSPPGHRKCAYAWRSLNCAGGAGAMYGWMIWSSQ